MDTALPAEESLPQRLVAGVLRGVLRVTVLRAFRAGRPIQQQRRMLARATRLTLAPRAAVFQASRCGGVTGEVVSRRGASSPPRALLYLHGGGYCVGSPRTHRAITGRLALLCEARVFAADYRLAPEQPFPAAIEDAVAAYRGLLAEGFRPQRVVIAGDSAGGGLSVATALRLRELGVPMPAAMVLFSPWVDLDLTQLPAPPRGEVMISRPWIDECAHHYLAGHAASDPLASPVRADLRGLPPALIQCGTDEVLRGDSRRLGAALQAAGVTASLQEYPRRWHVFQANAGMLADADRALAVVRDFVCARTA